MNWQEVCSECDKLRLNSVLDEKKFKRLIGKPERIYIEKNRVHCEYGIIGGQIVNKDFVDLIVYNSFIYWLKQNLPIRKGRKNSLTVIYRCLPVEISNPIFI